MHGTSIPAPSQIATRDCAIAIRFMSSGVIVIGPDDRILLFNDRVLEHFSAPADAIAIGMDWRDYLRNLAPLLGWNEERAGRVITNHLLWMDRDEPTEVEHHFDDGKVIRVICTPLEGGGAVLTYDDVTEAHRQSKERERAEVGARQLERRFKLLVEGITDYAIYLLNPDGTVANWNAGAERAKGYGASEIIGEHYSRFFSDQDRASELPRIHLETALREGRFETEGPRFRKDGSSFWAHVNLCPIYEDDGSLVGFAKITRDRTEYNQNAEKIAYLARHDALTGLPNRLQFVERLETEMAHAALAGTRLALINMDLDDFKVINDTHGHAAGDGVLQMLAASMRSELREGELVGRFGGDEFIALKVYEAADDLHEFVARMHAAVTRPVKLGEKDLAPGASFGVACYPDDAMTQEKLLSNADMAMYRAKASLDAKICFFEIGMDEAARERRSLAIDLWSALANDELCLHYQEQRSIATGEIAGYEALLRWAHPTRGNIPPTIFIPIAEECGAISAIGDWVIETACREAVERDLPKVAVNLSPLQLNHVGIVERVRDILVRTGLSPRRLELEVTESAVIADRDRALFILRRFKDMGVGIAIDDFGTGYSSLETLRSFPFDRIKLDRSFTDGLEHNRQAKAFVRAMLTLGHSLNLSVLAEGVETEGQLAFLTSEGCNEVQGFLFGQPAPLRVEADMCRTAA